MNNCVSINLRKDEILLKISEEASREDIVECLNEKIEKLSIMYKEEKMPIYVTGKILKEKEEEEIKKIIKDNIDVDVEFDTPKEMGLSEIKRVYEKNIDVSETKYYKGSLRGGQRIEYEGSIVILGDINGGAEVLAGENIVVLGALRGLAHAGAKGNKKAIISANSIEAPQLRIANLVKEVEREEFLNKKKMICYIENDKIVIE